MPDCEDKDMDCCAPSDKHVAQLLQHLEKTDSRLSVVESALRQVQGSMHTWSDIVQEGLADLSVQVHAVKIGRNIESMDDSKASVRLSKVEKQVQSMQMEGQEAMELDARIVKLEKQLQELQAGVLEMQPQGCQKTQRRNKELKERLEAFKGTCDKLDMTLDIHKSLLCSSSSSCSEKQNSANTAAMTATTTTVTKTVASPQSLQPSPRPPCASPLQPRRSLPAHGMRQMVVDSVPSSRNVAQPYVNPDIAAHASPKSTHCAVRLRPASLAVSLPLRAC